MTVIINSVSMREWELRKNMKLLQDLMAIGYQNSLCLPTFQVQSIISHFTVGIKHFNIEMAFVDKWYEVYILLPRLLKVSRTPKKLTY